MTTIEIKPFTGRLKASGMLLFNYLSTTDTIDIILNCRACIVQVVFGKSCFNNDLDKMYEFCNGLQEGDQIRIEQAVLKDEKKGSGYYYIQASKLRKIIYKKKDCK